jgi:hypothetical protein
MTQGPLRFPFPTCTSIWIVTGLFFLFTGCGEPMCENAGSQHFPGGSGGLCHGVGAEFGCSCLPPEFHGVSGLSEPGLYRYESLHRTQRVEASQISTRAGAGESDNEV